MLKESRGRYRVARVGRENVTLDPGHPHLRDRLPDRGRAAARRRRPADPALLEPHPGRLAAGHRGVAAGRAPAGRARRRRVRRRRRPDRRVRGRGRRHDRHRDDRCAAAAHTRHDPRRSRHGHAPAGDTRPWTARYDPVFGPSVWLLPIVAALIALAGLLGWRAARSAHEPTPPFPLMYAPARRARAGAGGVPLHRGARPRGLRRHDAVRRRARRRRRWSATRAPGRSTDAKGPVGWAGLDPVTNRRGAAAARRGRHVRRGPQRRLDREDPAERADVVRGQHALVGPPGGSDRQQRPRRVRRHRRARRPRS